VCEVLGIPVTPEIAAGGKVEVQGNGAEGQEGTGQAPGAGGAPATDKKAKGEAAAESAADVIMGIKDPTATSFKLPGMRQGAVKLPDTRIKQQSAYEGPAGGSTGLAREGEGTRGKPGRPFARNWAPRAATRKL
jgi:hypothetical protein